MLHLLCVGSWRGPMTLYLSAEKNPSVQNTNFFKLLFPRSEILAWASHTSCTCLCMFQGTSPAGWALYGPADTELWAAKKTRQIWANLKMQQNSVGEWRIVYLAGAVVVDAVFVPGLLDSFREVLDKFLNLLQVRVFKVRKWEAQVCLVRPCMQFV